MSEKEIVKEYVHGEITVIWKPRKCIHSEICVKTLPGVYKPGERPWIRPEKASVKELTEQIATCPSGALNYKLKNEDTMAISKNEGNTKVEVVANGPLLVSGTLSVTLPDGTSEIKKRNTAFCRCGASGNKPYCDGSHNDTGFRG